MTNTVGVVKIGYTDRDPDTRVSEWSRATGVPGKAEVKYAALVENPHAVEQAIHRTLAKVRQSRSEWFMCEVSDAVAALKTHTNVLFEDDRVAAAIEAESKKREAEAKKKNETVATQQRKERERITASKIEAQNTLNLSIKAEEEYLNALTRWETTPKQTWLDHLGILFGLTLLTFIVFALVTDILGINIDDNSGVFMILLVAIIGGIFWRIIQPTKKPMLKDFLTTESDSRALSIRELQLEQTPVYREKIIAKNYKDALTSWQNTRPSAFYLFPFIALAIWIVLVYSFVAILQWPTNGVGSFMWVLAAVSAGVTYLIIEAIKKRHDRNKPKRSSYIHK